MRSTLIVLRTELEYNTHMARHIAKRLQQIRESQGVSLEEIAHKTRIPLVYLQAIEEGDEESLPSKVQLRGFLRLYANELGVELDDLQVGGYHLASKMPTKTPAEQLKEGHKTLESSPEPHQPDLDTTAEAETKPQTQTEPEPETEAGLSSSSYLTIDPETTPETNEHKTSAEIFTSIGRTLKRRREYLSLSIIDIHESTHIREEYLTSIEAGAFNQLPSLVQAKGMLDNYADYLNLDAEAILLDYSEALQLQRIEKQQELPKRGSRSARELSSTALRLKNFFSLDLLVITALFITFAIFVIWGVNRILENDGPAMMETEIPGVSEILLAIDTPTPVLNDEIEITEIDEDQTDEMEEEEEPLFDPELGSAPINIILLPRQRLWVEVTADGEMVFQGRLLPGNAYDFTAQEQMDILTGNIGGLQILFNNQDIGSQGQIGQVANLSFTENGLVLPPATATPTITETPEATPTPTPTPEELDD